MLYYTYALPYWRSGGRAGLEKLKTSQSTVMIPEKKFCWNDWKPFLV
jgi:hypothetical protein